MHGDPKTLAGKRVCSYLRVSDGHRQDTASQRQMIEQATAPHGVTISQWYADDQGRNSRDRAERRRQFQRLLADVQAGRWDAIWIDSRERFGSKHSYETGHWMNLLLEHRVQLWSVEYGWSNDPDDVAGPFMAVIHSLKSREDQRKLAFLVQRGRDEAIRAGEFVGGNIAYGFDVGVFDGDDLAYRIRPVGPRRYLHITPDGTATERIGFPPREEHHRAFLVPGDPARLQVVELIFKKFLEEDLTAHQIAQVLNRMGIKTNSGSIWNNRHVEPILLSPFYAGQYAIGKESQARFVRLTNQGRQQVKWEGNRPVIDRRPDEATWVKGHNPHLTAVIDPGTARTARDKFRQQSLLGRTGKRKAVRSEDLWLAGLVVCHHCDRPMYGRSPKQTYSRVKQGFYCASRMDEAHGKPNPTRCRWHSIPYDLIEGWVGQYVESLGQTVRHALKVQDAPLVSGILEELGGQEDQLRDTLRRIRHFVDDVIEARGLDLKIQECEIDPGTDVITAYRHLYETKRAEILNQRAELARLMEQAEARLDKLTDPRLIRRQEAKMAEIQDQIDALAADLEPLDQRLDTIYSELRRLDDAITAARAALAGNDIRRKSAAVRAVIKEVRCEFEHVKHGGRGRKAGDRLLRATIVPMADDQPVKMFLSPEVGPPPR